MDAYAQIPFTSQAPEPIIPGTEHVTGRSGEAGVISISIGTHILLVDAEQWEAEQTIELAPAGLFLRRRPCDMNWSSRPSRQTYYAVSTVGRVFEVRLHRLLLNAKRHTDVDHKNGNGLDNRLSNLRFATALQNSHNRRSVAGTSSGFMGVHWHRRDERWHATVCDNGKKIFLGGFSSEIDAAIAHDKWVKQHRPVFGYLNFPDEVQQ